MKIKQLNLVTDQVLIQQYLVTQDTALLDILVQRYYTKVFHYCLTAIKNRDSARDLTQDVFLKMCNNLGKLKNPDLFIAWLFRIAHNLCIDYLNKNKRQRVVAIQESHDETEEVFDEEEARLWDTLCDKVGQAMAQTDWELRKLLVARYFDEKSIAELQKEYGLSESAVKMRLLRGRKQILTMLEKPAA